MTVLVTAASTAAAYKIKNTLRSNEVIMGDYEDLPEVMVTAGKMIKLPHPQSASYIHEILALCLDKSVSIIIPLREVELKLLNEANQLFEEYNIKIEQLNDFI